MGCRYCDFPAPKASSPEMTVDLARRALDSYFHLLQESGSRRAAIHFFGGVLIYAERVVHFSVEYAACQAAKLGMQAEFEVATNGLFDADRCRWIAARFDTVVLSLDGSREIQELQRPALDGELFDRIERNALILSEGSADLALRACISMATVGRMEEIADWFTTEFRPASVCFAPLTESKISRRFGLLPPPAMEFARNFQQGFRYPGTPRCQTRVFDRGPHPVPDKFLPGRKRRVDRLPRWLPRCLLSVPRRLGIGRIGSALRPNVAGRHGIRSRRRPAHPRSHRGG